MQRLVLVAAFVLLAGCASYTTPGEGVSLSSISAKDADIAEAFARQPAMVFPARLAVVRVGNARSNFQSGRSGFELMTQRDVETDDDFAALGAMPQVAGLAPLSRLLVSGDMASTRDLRTAAAQVKADALLVYTITTTFHTEVTQLGPLQTVALGFLATNKAKVKATCSFMIVDVRTGFVYGVGETTAGEDQRSNFWGSREAVDKARAKAEAEAFNLAVKDVGKLWNSVVLEHAGRRAA